MRTAESPDERHDEMALQIDPVDRNSYRQDDRRIE